MIDIFTVGKQGNMWPIAVVGSLVRLGLELALDSSWVKWTNSFRLVGFKPDIRLYTNLSVHIVKGRRFNKWAMDFTWTLILWASISIASKSSSAVWRPLDKISLPNMAPATTNLKHTYKTIMVGKIQWASNERKWTSLLTMPVYYHTDHRNKGVDESLRTP